MKIKEFRALEVGDLIEHKKKRHECTTACLRLWPCCPILKESQLGWGYEPAWNAIVTEVDSDNQKWIKVKALLGNKVDIIPGRTYTYPDFDLEPSRARRNRRQINKWLLLLAKAKR